MEKSELVEAFGAIAQRTRLDALRLLLDHYSDGLPAGEIARMLAVPQNTMSAHLSILKRAGLVHTQRDGTTIFYRPDTERVWQLAEFLITDFAGLATREQRDPAIASTIPRPKREVEKAYNVLFLCTGNSIRSLMAEAILNDLGQGRFRAFSAGSRPVGEVHNMALKVLGDLEHPTGGLHSKSWEVFAGPEAPQMDFVFTVCDNAAGEPCPSWPGHPITGHWGIEDPATVTGSEVARLEAFRNAARFLTNRIKAFISLPLDSIDRIALAQNASVIGINVQPKP